MVICCIVGCSVSSDVQHTVRASFYCIPAVIKNREEISHERRMLRLSLINRKELSFKNEKKVNSSRVCNKHFVCGKYNNYFSTAVS